MPRRPMAHFEEGDDPRLYEWPDHHETLSWAPSGLFMAGFIAGVLAVAVLVKVFG